MPNEHADISPSTLNYRKQCRQWSPRREESAAATEGTLLHAACETTNPIALDGEQLPVYDAVQKFLAPLRAGATKELREIRLNINLGPGYKTFGTCDCLIFRPGGLAHLIDFKFGRNSVPEANDNLQALAYAVGAFDAYPEVDRIQAWLLIPRRDEASSVVLERRDLETYRQRLRQLFSELTPTAPATPCDACAYCEKLATCSAVARTGLAVATRYDKELATLMASDMHPSRMTTEQLDTLAMPLARVLEKWASSVKAELLERATAGAPLTHHVIAERAMPVQLDDANAAYAAVQELVPLTEFHTAVSVSLPGLIKIVRSHAPRGKKDAAEQELLRRLSAAGIAVDADRKVRFLRRK